MNRITFGLTLSFLLFINFISGQEIIDSKWSEERANLWYSQFNWLAGTNFSPSTAINQLEMWQAETFDLNTIDRELKWSAKLGFNVHRVYLHNLVWENDSIAFLERIDKYLAIADKYGIKTMFVLLDDVWNPNPKTGVQPEPVLGVHNSGWVQSPGREYLEDESKHVLIKSYVQAVLNRFKHDKRILLWDLYNEPGNNNASSYGAGSELKTEFKLGEKEKYTFRLLKKVFQWSRTVNPSQPLSVGIWKGIGANWGSPGNLPKMDRYMIENSDIITFHAYDNNINRLKRKIEQLKKYKRPIICTEYMARTNNNTFEEVMPVLKKEKVGAINWGFVAGKTNTIYPWKTWKEHADKEPDIWFHDILRQNGTPYSQEEVDLIKKLTLIDKK